MPLFDRRLVRARSVKGAPFSPNGLTRYLNETLLERLSYLKRTFQKVLVLNPWPEFPVSDGVVTAGWHKDCQIICDDELLPFAPQSFDLVISCLSLHHVNDVPGALIQIRQVLVPDGLFLGCFFGQNTLAELREVLQETELTLRGGISPRVAPMISVRDAGALLQRAGFALPVSDYDRLTIEFENLPHLMKTLKIYGLSNALLERPKGLTPKSYFDQAAYLYQEKYQGRCPVRVDMVHISGWAPSPHQPKPLLPGSAQYQLRDLLR